MALQRGDRLAVLTSGGDAPGMNAALRAAAADPDASVAAQAVALTARLPA